MTPQEIRTLLTYRYNCHSIDTNGFTLDFESMSDEDVFWIPVVLQDTIDLLSNWMLPRIVPKQRKELKNNISYLIALRHRQQVAWKNTIQKWEEDYQLLIKSLPSWVQERSR